MKMMATKPKRIRIYTPEQKAARALCSLKARAASRDDSVITGGKEKSARILLGLAISRAHLQPGEARSFEDMAVFCGCTSQALKDTFRVAMQKVTKALTSRDKELGQDLLHTVLCGRSTARATRRDRFLSESVDPRDSNES